MSYTLLTNGDFPSSVFGSQAQRQLSGNYGGWLFGSPAGYTGTTSPTGAAYIQCQVGSPYTYQGTISVALGGLSTSASYSIQLNTWIASGHMASFTITAHHGTTVTQIHSGIPNTSTSNIVTTSSFTPTTSWTILQFTVTASLTNTSANGTLYMKDVKIGGGDTSSLSVLSDFHTSIDSSNFLITDFELSDTGTPGGVYSGISFSNTAGYSPAQSITTTPTSLPGIMGYNTNTTVSCLPPVKGSKIGIMCASSNTANKFGAIYFYVTGLTVGSSYDLVFWMAGKRNHNTPTSGLPSVLPDSFTVDVTYGYNAPTTLWSTLPTGEAWRRCQASFTPTTTTALFSMSITTTTANTSDFRGLLLDAISIAGPNLELLSVVTDFRNSMSLSHPVMVSSFEETTDTSGTLVNGIYYHKNTALCTTLPGGTDYQFQPVVGTRGLRLQVNTGTSNTTYVSFCVAGLNTNKRYKVGCFLAKNMQYAGSYPYPGTINFRLQSGPTTQETSNSNALSWGWVPFTSDWFTPPYSWVWCTLYFTSTTNQTTAYGDYAVIAEEGASSTPSLSLSSDASSSTAEGTLVSGGDFNYSATGPTTSNGWTFSNAGNGTNTSRSWMPGAAIGPGLAYINLNNSTILTGNFYTTVTLSTSTTYTLAFWITLNTNKNYAAPSTFSIVASTTSPSWSQTIYSTTPSDRFWNKVYSSTFVPSGTSVRLTITATSNGTGSTNKALGFAYFTLLSNTDKPGSPTSLTATPTDGAVALSWSAPATTGTSSITSYTINYTYSGGSGSVEGVSGTSGTVTSLTNGTLYSFTVTAVNGSGSGTASAGVAATPRTTPGAPTGLSATPSNGSVALSWTAPSSNGGAAITSYVVEYTYAGGSGSVEGVSGTSTTITSLTNGVLYTFTAAALNAVGTGTASSSATATPATTPGTPTGLGATTGNGSLALSWTAPASNGGAAITSYTITYNSGGDDTSVTGISGTSTTLTGLSNGTTYTIRVAALNSQGTSTLSSSVTGTPSTVPGAPTGLTATSGANSVALSWTAPASNGGASITSYTVSYSSTEGSESVSSIVGTSTTITGLTNGTSYTFTVAAVNTNGGGSSSDSATSTPSTTPGAPTELTATKGNASVDLSWTAPLSDGGANITSYTVSYTWSGGSGSKTAISGTSTTVTDLTNGTLYSFTVAAVNTKGTGTSSGSATATPSTVPGAPSSLTATAGNGSISLSWSAPDSNGGATITSYTVEYTSTEGNVTVDSISGTSTTISSLTNSTSYTFTVAAVNTNGTGTASSSVTKDPGIPPSAPTSLEATPSNGTVVLNWSAPASDGGFSVTSYTASYTSASSGSGSLTDLTDTTATFESLTNGVAYSFSVVAINTKGTGTAATTTSTPATVPDAPTSLTPTAGDAQVALSWTAPAWNGGASITSYTITYGTVGGQDSTSVTGIASTSTTITGLTSSTAYSFVVAAVNAQGTGSASSSVNATPGVPPSAPQNLAVTYGNASVDLTWDAPASDGGAAVSSYTVEYTWSGGSSSKTNITSTSTTVDSLTNGTLYTFTVVALNTYGTGTSSDPVTATPLSTPGAPSGLTASVQNASIGLSWSAPASNGGASVTSYTVSYTWSGGSDSATGISGTSTTITSLTNGTAYTFAVAAVNSEGTGTSSGSATATPATTPGTPTDLTATSGDTSVDLSWTAPASNGGATVTYTVTYGASTVTGITSTSTTITGLTNGTSYSFTVTAVNSQGSGAASSSASATPSTTPGAPTNLAATSGNAQVALRWTPPSSTGGASITSYTITRSSTEGTQSTTDITATPAFSGSTSGVTQSTTRAKFGTASALYAASGNPHMKVTGITTSGFAFATKGYCLECFFYPTSTSAVQTLFSLVDASGNRYLWLRMDTNRNLVADFGSAGSSFNGGTSATSTNTVTLNAWNHVVFQYDTTGYQIYINGSRGLNYGQTGLNPPSSAFAQLYVGSYGLNNTPQNSLISASIDEVRFSNNYRYSGTSFTPTSSAFTSDSQAVFLHHFDGTNTSTDFGVGQEVPSDLAYTVTGLTNGILYTFTVAAVNIKGTGTASSSVTSTPSTTAGAPTGLTATYGNTSVALSWTAPASDGGATITSYTVAYTWSGGNSSATGISGTSTTVTGLTNGTLYSFTVAAVNAKGTSTASGSATATPSTTPGAPTGLSATTSSGSVALTWSAPSSNGGATITSYTVTYTSSAGNGSVTGISGTSRTITGLTDGYNYTYTVAAVNLNGTGTASSSVTAGYLPPVLTLSTSSVGVGLFTSAVQPLFTSAALTIPSPNNISTVVVNCSGITTSSETLVLDPTYTLPSGITLPSTATFLGTSSGVTHNTTRFKFGTAGAAYAASGNPYLKVTGITTSGFAFASNGYCLECFFYPTTASANQTLFSLVDASNNRYLWFRMDTNRRMVADFGSAGSSFNGGTSATSTNAVTLNTWSHIVFQYDATGYQIYINGSRGLNYTQTGLNPPSSAFAQLYVGSYGLNNSPQSSVISGFIDEIRFSNRYRYSGTSFTPTSSAFTGDSTTVFLHHFNGTDGSTNFSVGQEVPAGASLSTSATGQLSFSGVSSASNYQAVIRKVCYQRSLTTSATTFSKTVSVTITGSNSLISTSSLSLVAQAVPYGLTTSATVDVNISSEQLIYASASVVSDVTGASLVIYYPTIISGSEQVALAAAYSLPAGLSFTTSSDKTTMTLSGSAAASTYVAVLQQLAYTRTTTNSYNSFTRVMYLTLTDANGDTYCSTTTLSGQSNTEATVSLTGSTVALDICLSTAQDLFDSSNSITTPNTNLSVTQVVVTYSTMNTSQARLLMTSGYSLPAGISASVSGGTLTLSGTASADSYTAALRKIQYQRTVTSDKTTFTNTISVQVTASNAVVSTGSISVSGSGTIYPTVTATASTIFDLNTSSEQVLVDSSAVITCDPDYQVAQVVLTYTDRVTLEEELAIQTGYSLPSGISVSTDSTTLTLSGNASASNYTDALKHVVYKRLSTTNNVAFSRTIGIEVTGTNDSRSGSTTITIEATCNLGPTLTLSTDAVNLDITNSGYQTLFDSVTTNLTAPQDLTLSQVMVTLSGISTTTEQIVMDPTYSMPSGLSSLSTTGGLYISGTAATESSWAAALKRVTYHRLITSDQTPFTKTLNVVASLSENTTTATGSLTLKGAALTPVLATSVVVDLNSDREQILFNSSTSILAGAGMQLNQMVITYTSWSSDETIDLAFGVSLPSGVALTTSSTALTFAGTASVATYTSLLKHIIYKRLDTSATASFTRSISVALQSTTAQSGSSSITLVGRSSYPPTLTLPLSAVQLSLSTSTDQVLFGTSCSIGMPTSVNVSSLTVSYSGISTSAEQIFVSTSYSLPSPLTKTTTSSSITLSGSASASTYTTALRNVYYKRLDTTATTTINTSLAISVTGDNTLTATGSLPIQVKQVLTSSQKIESLLTRLSSFQSGRITLHTGHGSAGNIRKQLGVASAAAAGVLVSSYNTAQAAQATRISSLAGDKAAIDGYFDDLLALIP